VLNEVVNYGQTAYDQLTQTIYAEDGVGNEENISKISVGMRNEAEYGTKTDFVMPQCYWQQLGAGGSGIEAWDEPVVNYQQSGSSQDSGSKTMPWPGHDAWSKDSTLLVMPGKNLKMFDLDKGHAKSREEEAYRTGELGEVERVVPQQEYKVIKMKE
jgi:hypothetical protein